MTSHLAPVGQFQPVDRAGQYLNDLRADGRHSQPAVCLSLRAG
jgi:hypothetical protein